MKEENIKTTVSKNKDGYGYKYTDLAQIHDYLESINARYIQQVKRIENDDYVMTKRCFDGVWEEEWLQGAKIVDAVLNGIKNPAQEQGSALTYARRYSLLMAFGLATEDDDAASLSVTKDPTLEDAKNYVISFGKYNGKKLSEVIKDNWYKNYLLSGNDEYIKKCIELLTGVKPLTEEEQKQVFDAMGKLDKLLNATKTDRDKFYSYYGVTSNGEMTLEQLQDANKKLEEKYNKEVL